MNKKIKVVVTSLLILSILSITFGVTQYMENKKYESYLSHQLVNDISTFSSLTGLNSLILNEVLTEQIITKEQYSAIKRNYNQIMKKGSKIIDLSTTSLYRVDSSSYGFSPYPIFMAGDFHDYLNRSESSYFNGKEQVDLIQEQVERLEIMKDVSDTWIEAVANNITGIGMPAQNSLQNLVYKSSEHGVTKQEYFDTYRDDIVSTNDWVKMVEQMQKNSKEYENEFLILFR